jgi:hypothetical protein
MKEFLDFKVNVLLFDMGIIYLCAPVYSHGKLLRPISMIDQVSYYENTRYKDYYKDLV